MLSTAKAYVDIGVAVLVLALIVFCGWEYDQRKLDADKITAAQLTVTQLQQGLAQLQQGQQASDAQIAAVAASATAGVQRATTVRKRVVTMGKSDAKVQSWLDTALPAGGCMLDDTCSGGAAGSAAESGPASIVR